MSDEPQVVIHRTERPNSLEFGPATARHKIFYEKPSELEELVFEALQAHKKAEIRFNTGSVGWGAKPRFFFQVNS